MFPSPKTGEDQEKFHLIKLSQTMEMAGTTSHMYLMYQQKVSTSLS